jgi:VanZ family protein
MLLRIKNLLVKNALYIALLCTLTIAVLSLIKMPSDGLDIPSSDKVSHVVAYFSLTLSWLYFVLNKASFHSKIKYVILGCFVYGIVIEILQAAITAYRTASYLDILANSVGIALAVVLFHVFEKKIRLI